MIPLLRQRARPSPTVAAAKQSRRYLDGAPLLNQTAQRLPRPHLSKELLLMLPNPSWRMATYSTDQPPSVPRRCEVFVT